MRLFVVVVNVRLCVVESVLESKLLLSVLLLSVHRCDARQSESRVKFKSPELPSTFSTESDPEPCWGSQTSRNFGL